VSVNYGASRTFNFAPPTGYHLTSLVVDGDPVINPGTSYTFNNVTANRNIVANFAIDTFTINASATGGGSISPAGAVSVDYGASPTFTITPDTGYHVTDVLVDGRSVGAVGDYTFDRVTTGHSITASFSDTYTITASAGLGGAISPSGAIQVTQGSSRTFTITPDAGYNIKSVLVDAASVGPLSSYTFPNIAADHRIMAGFVARTIRIIPLPYHLRVPRGGTSTLLVKLSDNPYGIVRVTVARQSGNPAITVSGSANLTFTAANWNLWQQVRLTASRLASTPSTRAIFLLSSPGVEPLMVEAEIGGVAKPSNIGGVLNLLLMD
jgi:hypothetical protein